jgi:hypothetical protein
MYLMKIHYLNMSTMLLYTPIAGEVELNTADLIGQSSVYTRPKRSLVKFASPTTTLLPSEFILLLLEDHNSALESSF